MKTNEHWSAFDEAFRHFNRGWAAADRAFEAMAEGRTSTGNTHCIHASSWRARIRLFRLFTYLAWRILVRGRVTVKL